MGNQERTFKDWTLNDIIVDLGLVEVKNTSLLVDWLTVKSEIEPWQELTVDRLIKKANNYIEGWNEQELLFKFIGHVIELVDFDVMEHFFAAFSERRIEITYNNLVLKGKVDWMVAIGRTAPILPFFFYTC